MDELVENSHKKGREILSEETYVVLWRYIRLLEKAAEDRNIQQDIFPNARDIAEEEYGKYA
jgi:hypothetical protein